MSAEWVLAPDIAERIRTLAAERDEPFYAYVGSEIRKSCRRFLDLPWPDTSVHVAMMANESPQLLAIVRDAGLGVFVNSLPHLGRAGDAGFAGKDIVFAASAMNERTMRAVREAGAGVNLDSLGEVSAWRALFPDARVGIRCNIGELVSPQETRAGYFLGRESRLGLTVAEMESLAGDPWVAGLHMYVGTDILDIDYFRDCYERLASFAPRFPALEYLDFGGGFGVPASPRARFDFSAYAHMVTEVMTAASEQAGRPLRLVLEPGRIIGAEAGYFVARVVNVKWRGGRQLVGVSASVAQFPRPLFYPDEAQHPATILPVLPGHAEPQRGPRAVQEPPVSDPTGNTTDVYGCSTYSRDYLARDLRLPAAQPGDLVVFSHAGSYCASAYTRFLGFPRPEEVMV